MKIGGSGNEIEVDETFIGGKIYGTCMWIVRNSATGGLQSNRARGKKTKRPLSCDGNP